MHSTSLFSFIFSWVEFSLPGFCSSNSTNWTWVGMITFACKVLVKWDQTKVSKLRNTSVDLIGWLCFVFYFVGMMFNIIAVPPQMSDDEETLQGAKIVCGFEPEDSLNPSYYHSFGLLYLLIDSWKYEPIFSSSCIRDELQYFSLMF